MADDDSQVTESEPTAAPEGATRRVGGTSGSAPAGATAGKTPGWYSRGSNPNEQSYWDGQGWSGARHWVAGSGWIEGSVGGGADPPPPGPPGPSANPYVQGVPAATPRTRVAATPTPTTFSLAVFLTVVSGIALMYGSVGSWVTVSGTVGTANFQGSLNGIDQGVTTLIGVNGYITFIGGIVLLVLGGLALSSEEKLLVVLTTIVALAVLVFAIYDMFRVIQKINNLPAAVNPHVSVGWGLICVLSAAVLAMLVSLARLLQQR